MVQQSVDGQWIMDLSEYLWWYSNIPGSHAKKPCYTSPLLFLLLFLYTELTSISTCRNTGIMDYCYLLTTLLVRNFLKLWKKQIFGHYSTSRRRKSGLFQRSRGCAMRFLCLDYERQCCFFPYKPLADLGIFSIFGLISCALRGGNYSQRADGGGLLIYLQYINSVLAGKRTSTLSSTKHTGEMLTYADPKPWNRLRLMTSKAVRGHLWVFLWLTPAPPPLLYEHLRYTWSAIAFYSPACQHNEGHLCRFHLLQCLYKDGKRLLSAIGHWAQLHDDITCYDRANLLSLMISKDALQQCEGYRAYHSNQWNTTSMMYNLIRWLLVKNTAVYD